MTFLRDPDRDAAVAGIASIDRLSWKDDRWQVAARLNGDQSNQGRELMMDPHAIEPYRIRLYTYSSR